MKNNFIVRFCLGAYVGQSLFLLYKLKGFLFWDFLLSLVLCWFAIWYYVYSTKKVKFLNERRFRGYFKVKNRDIYLSYFQGVYYNVSDDKQAALRFYYEQKSVDLALEHLGDISPYKFEWEIEEGPC